ncbi:hypothetical protein XENOCAPTIV_005194, partial [Xenoophorus captivus]
TLELLFRITNDQNVTVIVEKMLDFLRIRDSSKLPQRFLQVICWVGVVLGEYSHLREDDEPDVVLRLLAKLLDMKSSSSETKCWILMAMTKLCSGGAAPTLVHDISETYSSSLNTMLRQRAHELQILSQDSDLQAKVLPRSASMEPVEVIHMRGCRAVDSCLKEQCFVDSSLSFLDGFVSEALAAGAAPYKPPHQRQEELCRLKALVSQATAMISHTRAGSTEQPTNPLVSPSDGADNLLCENLLDSSDLDVSSPEQTQGVPQDLTATNGSCNPEEELADTDTKGVNTPIIRDERVTAEPPPHKDPDRSKYLCLTSHLPAELSALSRSKITPLCSNQSLDVSACHVQKEDSVVLVVFVSNCSDSFLQQIRLQVNSEELEVCYATEYFQIGSMHTCVINVMACSC